MRCAYSAILISSAMLVSACSSAVSTSQPRPSLVKAQSRQIVQVAANFDPKVHRDTPYFVVCFDDECPQPTVKTPVKILALNTVAKGQKTSSAPTSNHSVRSDSYYKKKVEILSQYRVHFDYASAELNDEGKTLLGDFVKSYPHKNQSIIITGFTDNGTKPDGKIGNHWLALERALSVKKTLIALGYPETQILLEAKFLCCYIDSNESEAGRRNNRRAEISLIHVLRQ